MSLEGSLDVAHLHNGAQIQAQKDLQSEHTNYQGVRIVNFSAKRQMVGLEVVCYLVDR
jgi:hypothetical protein